MGPARGVVQQTREETLPSLLVVFRSGTLRDLLLVRGILETCSTLTALGKGRLVVVGDVIQISVY